MKKPTAKAVRFLNSRHLRFASRCRGNIKPPDGGAGAQRMRNAFQSTCRNIAKSMLFLITGLLKVQKYCF